MYESISNFYDIIQKDPLHKKYDTWSLYGNRLFVRWNILLIIMPK